MEGPKLWEFHTFMNSVIVIIPSSVPTRFLFFPIPIVNRIVRYPC